MGRRRGPPARDYRGVLRCWGGFPSSLGLVSRNDGGGWFLFRFRCSAQVLDAHALATAIEDLNSRDAPPLVVVKTLELFDKVASPFDSDSLLNVRPVALARAGELKRAMEQAASFMDRAVDEAVRGLIKRASSADILLDVIAARRWVDPINNPNWNARPAGL